MWFTVIFAYRVTTSLMKNWFSVAKNLSSSTFPFAHCIAPSGNQFFVSESGFGRAEKESPNPTQSWDNNK
jgi:hypothetical protein